MLKKIFRSEGAPRLRALWPSFQAHHPPAPTSRIIGRLNGWKLRATLWDCSERPDTDAVWMNFRGGCWISLRVE